ncbi:MAG: Calx-beta domain-containing protein [Actinomycetota bacterium]|nr:Calx-beta domain-containing protein [Actinomycetota bacterium]
MKKILALLVLAGVVAAAAVWQPWTDDKVAIDAGVDRAIAESVSIRTLTDEITIQGELRRDELQVVTAAAPGKVGAVIVSDGDTVEAGDLLLSLDGRQVVAVDGDFAFYRSLDVGSEGADVRQLEEILSAAGHHVGEVDDLYTEETRAGLAAWQAARGYVGTTPEADEVVTVSLQANPVGYTVGPVNAVSVRIGSVRVGTDGLQSEQFTEVATTAAAVVDAVAVADSAVPTVSLSAAAVVVTEGWPVVVTVTTDVAPTADLEVPISVSGDVVVDDDYVAPDATVVIPAGSTSATVEIATIRDDDREAYEDLKVSITGSFDSLDAVAPQTLAVYDARKEVDDLLDRVDELVDDIAEKRDDVADLEAEDELVTTVEDRLVVAGILTDGQARAGDVSPAEAAELEDLQQKVDDAAEVVRYGTDFITTVEERLVSLGILTQAQARAGDVSPAEAAELEDLQQKVEDVDEDISNGKAGVTILDWHAAVAARDNAVDAAIDDVTELDWRAAVAARDDAVDDALEQSGDLKERLDELEVLLDEQQRLDYRLASARETLRVAQASRWVLGDADEVTVSIDDPDVPDEPILVLRADGETVGEGGTATFTIETTVELVEDLDVLYVVGGTATADADYNAPDGDITMVVGQERVVLSIPIRTDDDVEGDETVEVRLLDDPSGAYRLSDRDRASIVVESNDLPELTLRGGGTVAEGESSTVTIVADQAPTEDTSVAYSVGGSAQAGVDYAVVTGTALLRAGERSVDVVIRTIDDDVVFHPGDMVVAQWPVRAGTVEVEEGDYVQQGTPLFDLTEPAFTIRLTASPTDRARLAVGQDVTVNLDAGDQESPGTITELDDNATTSSSGTETYEGVVTAAQGLVGVDGAVVTIDVVVEESVDAVVVPIAAVLSDGGQETVRVVTPEGVIERRAIETGMLDGAYVEVVSGVSPGEYVILEIDRS